MSFLTWSLVFFLGGIVAFVSPVILPTLPLRYSKPLADWYFGLAGRAAIALAVIRRKLGGHTLVATEYHAHKAADSGNLSGQTGHFDDPSKFKSRVYQTPIGLGYDKSTAFVSPLMAEIGRYFGEWLEDDKHKIPLTAADLQGTDIDVTDVDVAFNRTLSIPRASTTVDLANIMHVLPASMRPPDAETAYDYIEKSQIPFHKKSTFEAMAIITAFAASMGLTMLALYQTGGGGVDVSLPIGMLEVVG